MSGVIFLISSVIILFTSKSPLLTGVLSDLISFVRPLSLKSNDNCPALKKVSIKLSVINFKSSLVINFQ